MWAGAVDGAGREAKQGQEESKGHSKVCVEVVMGLVLSCGGKEARCSLQAHPCTLGPPQLGDVAQMRLMWSLI